MKAERLIRHELERVTAALSSDEIEPIQRREFLAVQQALAWALDLRGGDVLAPFEYVSLYEAEQGETSLSSEIIEETGWRSH